jgi:hypothetical protein
LKPYGDLGRCFCTVQTLRDTGANNPTERRCVVKHKDDRRKHGPQEDEIVDEGTVELGEGDRAEAEALEEESIPEADEIEEVDLAITLSEDLKKSATMMTHRQARILVDTFYNHQKIRVILGNQIQALNKAGEPCEIHKLFFENYRKVEAMLYKVLDIFSDSQDLGRWARLHHGIGPIIAAGLLAHISIPRAKTAGAIWRYAGLDPTVQWLGTKKIEALVKARKEPIEELIPIFCKELGRNVETITRFATTNIKGEAVKLTKTTLSKALARIPWNAGLKCLCWKIGDSFCKVSGKDAAYYGQRYVGAKVRYVRHNDAGDYAALAATEKLRVGKSTEAYKAYAAGRLPKGRIELRARRDAVKLFLSHFWEVGRGMGGFEPICGPYAVDILDHAHKISPPNWDLELWKREHKFPSEVEVEEEVSAT